MNDRTSRPLGRVTFRAWRDGVLLSEERGPNLVVDGAASTFARLAASVGAISQFAVGSDGTAVSAEDTELTDMAPWALVSATPSAGAVTFVWRLPAGEAPAMTVREVGLLADDDNLVARRVLETPQPIDAGVELEGEWTLTWG